MVQRHKIIRIGSPAGVGKADHRAAAVFVLQREDQARAGPFLAGLARPLDTVRIVALQFQTVDGLPTGAEI